MAGDGKKTYKVRDRFKEGSTWASIAAIAAVAAGIPPESVSVAATALQSTQGQAAVIGAVVAGVVGILLPS